MSNNDFFEKYGLAVETSDVVIGQTYPLYGMITQVLDSRLESFTIEINRGLVLRCSIKNEESIEKVKSRAFEPAIFVATITNTDPVEGDCSTIIFGKGHGAGMT